MSMSPFQYEWEFGSVMPVVTQYMTYIDKLTS